MSIKTVLFDLDGTLADTAPDLADALNQTLRNFGAATLPFEKIRPHVSHGTIALLSLGFNINSNHRDFAHYREYLLNYYQNNIANKTKLFDGMEALLIEIEQRDLNWGIVTNKPQFFTFPLLDKLNLQQRAATIVCSDTLEYRKPHPAPMLHACREAGSQAHQCLYIGDAERDVQAGNNAGMTTLIAMYGYIAEHELPDNWGANGLIYHAKDILQWL